MRTFRFPVLFLAGLILLVTINCTLFSRLQSDANTPTENIVPTALSSEDAETISPTLQPEDVAPTESQGEASPVEPSSEEVTACPEKVCFQDGSFLLGRPIGMDGRYTIDTASRYGTLRKRIGDAYRGVQFLNSLGTPVLAAADGIVVVAGDDSRKVYGSRMGAYGNLVILEHSLPGISEPVYTLYAHLSEVFVEADETVERGEEIGLVGMSGSVRGSTLYFEVRLGKNSYDETRNPELWLELLPDETGDLMGALAGRIVNKDGNYVNVTNILVEHIRAPGPVQIRQTYLKTYIEKGLRGSDPWKEGFAAGNLPEGTYKISFWHNSERYEQILEVQPGMMTFVEFEVK